MCAHEPATSGTPCLSLLGRFDATCSLPAYHRRLITAIAITGIAVAAFIASPSELCDQSVLRLLHRRAGEFGVRDVGHPWLFEKDEVDASE
jgi:hypothetical protein